MALTRMNRDEFFAKLADKDEDRIKKAHDYHDLRTGVLTASLANRIPG